MGAICLHGIRTAEVALGETVAVIGLGLLGQITVQLLKIAGCRVLGMDLVEERAALAIQNGAEAASINARDFRNLCFQKTGGIGADAVLITAETPMSGPVNLAAEVARDRATVVAVGTVGMELERKLYYEKELTFRVSRSYGPGRYDTAYEAERPRLSHRPCALDRNAQHGSFPAIHRRPQARSGFAHHPSFSGRGGGARL